MKRPRSRPELQSPPVERGADPSRLDGPRVVLAVGIGFALGGLGWMLLGPILPTWAFVVVGAFAAAGAWNRLGA